MLRWNWHYIKIKIHIIYTIYFPRALLYRQTNIHEKLFVFQGNCLELGAYGVLNQVKCENFTGGSPVSPYLSDVIYRCMFMIFIIEIEIKKDIWEFNLFFFKIKTYLYNAPKITKKCQHYTRNCTNNHFIFQ